MGVATFLILEGALVGGLVILRVICIQHVDLDTLPRGMVRRVEIGNLLVPYVGALAIAAIVIGVALRLGS